MPRKLFISLILAASTLVGAARERALILREPARPDTIRPLEVTFPEPKKNLIGKIIDYFEDSNKEKKSKKFDISFIGGPHYSSDTKFGIGMVAAGQYYTDTTDYAQPVSDVSLYLDATTSLFFKIGLSGNHIFPQDKARIQYDVNISHVTTKFWGIGYDMDINDANESKYKYIGSQAIVSYVWRLAEKFYIGPFLSFDYINARDFSKPELWEGLPNRTFNFGAGFTIQYDSRDCITCAWKGAYVRLDQRFNPRFMLNRNAFSQTELTASFFHPLWRDAVIAYQLHSRLTYGNTPWGLMPTMGGSHNMRGYYEGRFRDKCEADVCVEIRQHVWGRSGVVAWVGAGTVFPNFQSLSLRKILPNYGIGYRWEFKKRMNVRLDLGFGRHQTGFIFSINEAF